MTDTTRTDADFDASYLRTWTEPDADRRRALIEQMWAPHGSLHISSPALTVTGQLTSLSTSTASTTTALQVRA